MSKTRPRARARRAGSGRPPRGAEKPGAAAGLRPERSSPGLSFGESSKRLPGVMLPALLLAAIVVVFHGAFSADFTYDDHFLIVNNPDFREGRFFDLTHGWGRQVRTLTLMLDRTLFGESPAGYHAHSVLWHGIATLGVYALFRRLGLAAALAFAGALVFAVHPIHVEGVTNVANRKEPLCLAFSIGSLLAWARFLETRDARRWAWLAASALAFLLALFSKQVAIVLPVSVFLYERLFVPPERRLLARHPWVLAGAGAVTLLGLSRWFDLPSYLARLDTDMLRGYRVWGFEGEPSFTAFVLTSARAFWIYVKLLVWPAGLCPDHRVALSTTLADPTTLAAWTALLALAVAALVAMRRAPVLAFGVLWLLVHFLPVSNWIPSAYVVADRYMYVPSVGYCLVLAAGAAALGRGFASRPPLATALPAALLGVGVVGYGARTWVYNAHWRDDPALWTYTLQCNEKSHRAHGALGLHHLREGRPAQALEHLDRAIALEPERRFVHTNRGLALLALSRHREAVRDFDTTLAREPDEAPAWYYRGSARFELGELEPALRDLDHALALDPDFAPAYATRGRVHQALGDAGAAIADYRRAVALDPSDAATLYNLGELQRLRGEREAAIESLRRSAELGLEPARRALAALRD